MSYFGGLPEQDLGDDFEFESDSRSLGEILGAEKPGDGRAAAVTPASNPIITPARVMGTKSFLASGLTPAKVKAPPKSHLGQGLELFQTKSGAIFWRQCEADKGTYTTDTDHPCFWFSAPLFAL